MCTLKLFSVTLFLLIFRAHRPITRLIKDGESPVKKGFQARCGQGENIFMSNKTLMAEGYSLAEEVANSISHGIGLIFGIVGLVLLLVQAVAMQASPVAITSYSLYGGSMILLFLASTLYHAIPNPTRQILAETA